MIRRHTQSNTILHLLLPLALVCCGAPEPEEEEEDPCAGTENSCQTVDATRCHDETDELQVCTLNDEGCPAWVDSPCTVHQLCDHSGEQAECICDNECEVSACYDSILETCMTDMDGCHFSVQTTCSPREVCHVDGTEAACVCTDPCTLDAVQCDGDMVQVCETDFRECLYWVDTQAIECPEHQGCTIVDNQASCGCADTCALGEERCDSSTLQHCAEDAAGCFYWSDAENCAASQSLCDDQQSPMVCDPSAVVITVVGAPLWEVTDVHQFSGRVETAEDFAELIAELMPNHNPWVAHAEPYDQEIATGMAAAGHSDHYNFTTAQFGGSYVETFHFTIIPSAGAPTGATPDSASGPMVPNSALPIVATGSIFRDEVEWDGPYQYALPGLEAYPPDVQSSSGLSHLHEHSGMPLLEGTEPAADYRWELEYLDAGGNGYTVHVMFRVQ